MRHIDAVELINERIKIAFVEGGVLICHRSKRGFRTIFFEFFLDLFDHCNRFVAGSVVKGERGNSSTI